MPLQAESAVNAGPAVYISPAGPNPIMVQVKYRILRIVISCYVVVEVKFYSLWIEV